MSRAFSAPRFDNYSIEMTRLIQNVFSRYGVSDPDIALFVLSRKRVVNSQALYAYTEFLMKRGEAEARNGRSQPAIAAYSEVLQFAQKTLLGNPIPVEQYLAQGIGLKAGEKLEALYASAGQKNEAAMVAFELDEWEGSGAPKVMRYLPLRYRQAHWDSLAWSGLEVNLAGLVLTVTAPVLLLSLLFLWMRRNVSLERRGPLDFSASLCADLAPCLFLAATLFLYFAYHPYARLCALFLKPTRFIPDFESFISAAVVPHAIPIELSYVRGPYAMWLGVTVLLFLALLLLVWRSFIQRKPSV